MFNNYPSCEIIMIGVSTNADLTLFLLSCRLYDNFK